MKTIARAMAMMIANPPTIIALYFVPPSEGDRTLNIWIHDNLSVRVTVGARSCPQNGQKREPVLPNSLPQYGQNIETS